MHIDSVGADGSRHKTVHVGSWWRLRFPNWDHRTPPQENGVQANLLQIIIIIIIIIIVVDQHNGSIRKELV